MFSRIPERFRWIVTGITAVSIVMLWYVFLYVPKKYFVQAPPLLSYEKLIDHVVYLAQKAHLSYDCTTSRIVLEGTFRDVQRFFAHAIRINGLVDVQKITCHRLANNQIKVTVVHA